MSKPIDLDADTPSPSARALGWLRPVLGVASMFGVLVALPVSIVYHADRSTRAAIEAAPLFEETGRRCGRCGFHERSLNYGDEPAPHFRATCGRCHAQWYERLPAQGR